MWRWTIMMVVVLLLLESVDGKEWVVKLPSGVNASEVAAREGLTVVRELDHLRGYFLFEGQTRSAKQATEYEFIEEQVPTMKYKRSLSLSVPGDPLYADQWHLRYPVSLYECAWSSAISGTGVTVAAIDDGLQWDHPDLIGPFAHELSYDFNQNDGDPYPAYTSDTHGTSVAGIIGAQPNDGHCGTGVAPGVQLAGIRLISDPFSDLRESEAATHKMQEIDIYSNSWGPPDDGVSIMGPGHLSRLARANAIAHGRQGRGNIYVWAAGNGRRNADNCNYDGWANSRYTIAVGAVSYRGDISWYSEPCSAVLITAPSSGRAKGIITSDLRGAYGADPGDCRRDFGGTSASTPYVAGVIALMLQTNPLLGWRDVQAILLTTAQHTDPTDPGWTLNGAGHKISHDYGFGLIDACAAIESARNWVNFEPKQQSVVTTHVDAHREHFALHWKVSNVSIGAQHPALIVEHVEVHVVATHSRRGDIELVLESPHGTRSTLATQRPRDTNEDLNWTFGSVLHWGETSAGQWSLHFIDRQSGQGGRLESWTLTLYGREN